MTMRILDSLRRHLGVLALCALLLPAGPAAAQTAPQRTDLGTAPVSILWVGNSAFDDNVNDSLHGQFRNLVAAGGGRTHGTSVTISGAGLDWHDMASLLQNAAWDATRSYLQR